MSLSTRESMRREFKELAKLAETMGKGATEGAVAESESLAAAPAEVLQRPPTPNGSSRVTVPPIATSAAPADLAGPNAETREARKVGSAKRSGIIAVLAGATLAAALVGGAVAAKSLAHEPSAAMPAVDVRGAAASMPPQPAVAAPAQPVPVTPSPAEGALDPGAAPGAGSATGAKSPVTGAGPAGPAAPAPAVVHKHAARPLAVAAPAGGNPKASNALPTSPTEQAAAKATAAPSPGLSKPAPAKASGGSDSLEDLIRKEVAGQKK